MTTVLECMDLRKTYASEVETVRALDGVSLQISAGSFTAIMGSSGSGKSTLLHLLGGLDRPSSGRLFLDGQEYSSLTDRKLTLLRRRRIGFVFQAFNLVPTLSAAENILLPLLLDGQQPDRKRLQALLAMLGLDGRAHHKPGQLSGGQQQRVAIARALITKPALILADEPTGNLDSQTADEVMRLLRRCCDEMAQTVVMVTHDPRTAAFADRIITLRDGRVESDLNTGGKQHAGDLLASLAQPL